MTFAASVSNLPAAPWTDLHGRLDALEPGALPLAGTSELRAPAQQIAFQEGIDALEDARQRLHRLEEQLARIVSDWSMAPVVDAYQALRGVSFVVAVTFAAEIGDGRRFETPRQLMAFLGLVLGERSTTGATVRRTGLTLAAGRSSLDLSLPDTDQRNAPGAP